jgi:hypothetical protein
LKKSKSSILVDDFDFFSLTKKMRIFLLLTLLPLNLMCQQHIQAEVTMQQLNNKKKIEIKKIFITI